MKRILLGLIMISIISITSLYAQEENKVSYGFSLLAGGRYDNVRMCVASPAGVPGGPIGEVYFDIRVPVSDSSAVLFNIPLFRPIVFAAAFNMLQLEPSIMYEHSFKRDKGAIPVLAGGVGVILHYGSDYHSSLESASEPFFSIGPLVNTFFGLALANTNLTIGVKGFFSPLITKDQPLGIVAGGGVEVRYTL